MLGNLYLLIELLSRLNSCHTIACSQNFLEWHSQFLQNQNYCSIIAVCSLSKCNFYEILQHPSNPFFLRSPLFVSHSFFSNNESCPRRGNLPSKGISIGWQYHPYDLCLISHVLFIINLHSSIGNLQSTISPPICFFFRFQETNSAHSGLPQKGDNFREKCVKLP